MDASTIISFIWHEQLTQPNWLKQMVANLEPDSAQDFFELKGSLFPYCCCQVLAYGEMLGL